MADSEKREDADPDPPEGTTRERGVEHLSDLSDGCGCTEVWEYLSADRSDPE